tara:strand:+ start:51 stop:302 length:252 start_codon:yes stop_codon:yes gene_type:complete
MTNKGKVKNKSVIKFTKDDIEKVYLDSHKYDRWATIILKTGVEIRSHSLELEQLILDKHKSYVAFGAITHTWLSMNNGEDFKV